MVFNHVLLSNKTDKQACYEQYTYYIHIYTVVCIHIHVYVLCAAMYAVYWNIFLFDNR